MPVQQKQIVTAYRYECELEFHGSDGKTSLEIQKEGLKYLTITHNYDEFIMPVMYMKVKLFPHVYNAMVPDQGKGKIYLNLIKTKILGATSNVPKSIITEEFDYYMTDNPNTYKNLIKILSLINISPINSVKLIKVVKTIEKINFLSFSNILYKYL